MPHFVTARRLALALALAASAPHAAPPAPTFDATIDCSQWDRLNNYEMKQCSGRANVAADAALNAVYGKLVAKLAAPERELLVAAERAWITWRDRECDFETQGVSGYDPGGTGYGLEWGQCRLALTKTRTAQLTRYLADVQNR